MENSLKKFGSWGLEVGFGDTSKRHLNGVLWYSRAEVLGWGEGGGVEEEIGPLRPWESAHILLILLHYSNSQI
jgi:hypothetical protein